MSESRRPARRASRRSRASLKRHAQGSEALERLPLGTVSLMATAANRITVPEILNDVGRQLVTFEVAQIERKRLVRPARTHGATWQQIGAKLGISAHEARDRYA